MKRRSDRSKERVRILTGAERDACPFFAELEALEKVPNRLTQPVVADGGLFDLVDQLAR